MKRIEVTTELRAAIAAVLAADASHVPGRDPSSDVELPRLALATAFLGALAVQERRTPAQGARLAELPKARPAVVVEVSLLPKRRRA